MPENRLARSLDGLLTQAEAIRLAGPEVWRQLNFKHNSPERLAGEMEAVRQAESRYRAVRSAKPRATARRAGVDNAAWDFLTRSRGVLSQHLGRQYSGKWSPLGFPGYSLRIPQQLNHRLALLANFADYFRAHPEHEIAGYATAHLAARHHEDLLAATRDINHCRAEIRAARNARDRAVTALRRRIRFITVELRMILGKDDPRWHAFGLNIPCTTRRRRKATQPATPPPAHSPSATAVTDAVAPPLEQVSAPANEADFDATEAEAGRAILCVPPLVNLTPMRTGLTRPALPRAHRKRSWLASLIPSWN